MSERLERLKRMAELYEEKRDRAKLTNDNELAYKMEVAAMRSWDAYYNEKRKENE